MEKYIYKDILTKAKVRDEEIEFLEKVKIDKETGEDVFDRELEIINTNNLYNIYRKKHNLCTPDEIKQIRNKYELSQTDFSLLLGFGKITIHRYENGSLQTRTHDNVIKNSNKIYVMEELIKENKSKVDVNVYEKLMKKIKELRDINTFINTKLLTKKDIYNIFNYNSNSYKKSSTNKFSIHC